VWSSAEKILTPSRSSTNPIQLEAILFLKYNKKYWNKYTVVQAIKLLKEEDTNERNKTIENGSIRRSGQRLRLGFQKHFKYELLLYCCPNWLNKRN
jgi:hypothetical protein